METKIKSNVDKINTNFHDKELPYKNCHDKEGSHCIYLSLILIDSIVEIDKNFYPQVFLEECKYIVKRKDRHIN